ncbi:hypothetical protein [Mongoliitalea daihaiensis]|uniref:hypothetical protein n=1 Tax=Mongoliitalea daihaiensis TaxID=2782006 RepID=UPI001F32B523|nr:hypothetical protein [Mongoliitalea daihaiensis]UJP65293.1 hypothetical protein IPZ59_01280 [Mongoliitalea daihaiensis]
MRRGFNRIDYICWREEKSEQLTVNSEQLTVNSEQLPRGLSEVEASEQLKVD